MDDETSRRRVPTIDQVAALAGVSRATVSRAFTRPEMLSEATVQRVKAIARDVGYVPNQVARALSTGRHGNLALIVPDVANPFFPPLIRAAQLRADEAGFCVFLGNSDELAAREDVLVGRFTSQVEGMILVSSRLDEERIRLYAERRPIVLVNRDVAGIPRVLIDSATGITAALAHLIDHGHRRIVYVSGPSASWSNQQRRLALRREAAKRGVEIIAIPARPPTHETGYAATGQILASKATAALAFDDLVAQGLLAGLAERGIDVPGQFSVVGCDDVLGATTYPPLTTVSARCKEAGQVAADLLMDLLKVKAMRDVRYVLESHLVVRGTTGPVAVS
ncbi:MULTISPECIES: LacI family DNA-binding transcriptional regulator [unclassified Chelatococcus]|uniref:LacI family DNA-binding transcriptional regulator n=1 Tax=unclassified Chelatococcus TaxID=2638111 RepID=UPI001BD06598|nr:MULTISPECIES: LacI family DNA-binding transcriptional regulator [unclassified Chelatococcus]CAH1650789.1 LacI family transcriptional regulator [Hyphomicrobiales bacterium]MBS7739774.1 LacI family DNA-binding transcriptional regulator [Chelatococcus sp. HY11]MBX3545417.1 LacI family DNA-binding transcriptional regulator [Chelatococcus sp.]MCO5078927.1 LacI family transcriptional regulator [Chelatococcus sp.]CAH1686458.1 LacI family transcriptional regulator [Hyphomicrobiales bacterium]